MIQIVEVKFDAPQQYRYEEWQYDSWGDSVTWGAGVANFSGTPQSFVFSFTQPIAVGTFNHAEASATGALTDGQNNGITISNFSVVSTFTPSGGSAINLGVDLTGSCTIANCSFTASSDLPSFSAPGSFTVAISFTLTPQDTASFNGTTAITEVSRVPEPSSFMLFGSGLAGFAGLVRRKLRR